MSIKEVESEEELGRKAGIGGRRSQDRSGKSLPRKIGCQERGKTQKRRRRTRAGGVVEEEEEEGVGRGGACARLMPPPPPLPRSDLALRNCLLTSDLTVRIGDYGLAHSNYKVGSACACVCLCAWPGLCHPLTCGPRPPPGRLLPDARAPVGPAALGSTRAAGRTARQLRAGGSEPGEQRLVRPRIAGAWGMGLRGSLTPDLWPLTQVTGGDALGAIRVRGAALPSPI